MLTLLSINNYFYRRGGSEAVFFDHNELFASQGWNIIPFAMQHPNNLESSWSKYFVEQLDIEQSGGITNKFIKASKSIYSLEAKRKIGQLIDKTNPSLAHGHNIYHHLSPSILGAIKSAGIPVILTLHDLKIACPAYKMMTHDGVCERCRGGRLDQVIWNRCIHGSVSLSGVVFLEAVLHRLLRSYHRHVDTFIVPSQFFIDKFVEWGWNKNQFRYVPNFVSSEEIQPDFEVGNSFVYFGRLAAEKGVATLIRAAEEAKVHLKIVGSGPMENELRKLAESSAVNTEFVGYHSGEALYDIVRKARAVVLPSEWYENAPISILEAYAMGKPVIGAAIGGIPEMIIEHQTGLTFQSGSVESLVEALSTMAKKSDGAISTMGRACREYVERQFSKTAYYQRCLSVYGEFASIDSDKLHCDIIQGKSCI